MAQKSMTIATWNVNGLRSQLRKSSISNLLSHQPDIICLQETRCDEGVLPRLLFEEYGYQAYLAASSTAGYAGTCILHQGALSLKEDLHVPREFLGRIQVAENQSLILINVYAPHGHRDQRNLPEKHDFFNYLKCLIADVQDAKPVVLVGDLNIAHQEVDVKRARANVHNTMFTEAERQHIDDLVSLGLTDVFRDLNPQAPGYTWWPWLASARTNDVGWRIDYVLASRTSTLKAVQASVLHSVQGSDHCPVIVRFRQAEEESIDCASVNANRH